MIRTNSENFRSLFLITLQFVVAFGSLIVGFLHLLCSGFYYVFKLSKLVVPSTTKSN